jgi:glycosyltransferase involved in cell wall biosynthesis
MMAHSAGIPSAIFKIFNPQMPYVLTLQEGDPPEYIERLAWPVWPLFSRAFTSADMVVAESTFLGRWARRMGFPGPLEVVPNGVNFVHFSQIFPADMADAVRFSLHKKPNDVFLVTTSRLVHKNAIDMVIRALTHLPANMHFIVYGSGPDESKLRKLTKDLNLEDRVHFMGHITHADMPLALAACDIYVRPSRSEGMGNVFIEAMAANLPVVATQEGGIADFLFDAKRNPDKETTGWAVDKDSPKQVAEAIKNILAHREQVARVTSTAKKLALENYDWNLIAKNMREKVFARVLK